MEHRIQLFMCLRLWSQGKVQSRAIAFHRVLQALTGLLNRWSVCDRAHVPVSVFTALTASGTGSQPLASARPEQQYIAAMFSEWVQWAWWDSHFHSAVNYTQDYLWVEPVTIYFYSDFGSLPSRTVHHYRPNWRRVPSVPTAVFGQTISKEPLFQSMKESELPGGTFWQGISSIFPRRGSFTTFVVETGLHTED